MKQSLMKLVVVMACHIAIPVGLGMAGFYALAIMTGHLIWAIAGGTLSVIVAWFSARRYTLTAIGPLFQDRDFPITWSFIARHVLKLLLLLLVTPAVVLTTHVAVAPFTPFSVTIAIIAGLPAQMFASFLLALDSQTWQWRIHRGRVIQSPDEIQRKITTHTKTAVPNANDCTPWAGIMVPNDLLAPHTKILGMTGSGKTVTIRLLLQDLVKRCSSARNMKILVFDPKRELYSYILGMEPQVPVLLLDATDQRGMAWDIAADITEPNQVKAAAKLLVPDEQTSQPYFPRSARRILEWVMRYLITHASHWNLQDVFMVLDDLAVLRRILPSRIVAKYFKPETTLKNTLSTLDTLTSRFETVAACWAKAEKEGRTISLNAFEASPGSAILVIPRRLDIADAIDPTIRMLFEHQIHLWLARPDIRFLPPDQRPETHVILDETAKAGNLARLDDLLLMGRAKGVSVTIAAQDVEAMRQEYGEKIADSLLAQCGNTAVFALESPETRDYCASLFGTYEVRERPRNVEAKHMAAALTMEPKDLYHPGEIREQKTLLSSQFCELLRPATTGLIAGYFITGGLGAHWAAYPFAHLLLPQANVPVLLPRNAADQEFPDHLTPADLKRLGIPEGKPGGSPPPASQPPKPSKAPATATTNSLRFINRITGK